MYVCVCVREYDGYIYGISTRRVIKFSQMDHSLSHVGRRFEEEHEWSRADVLADDGCCKSIWTNITYR